MNYDHNKKFGLLKFHSGYGTAHTQYLWTSSPYVHALFGLIWPYKLEARPVLFLHS